MQPHLFLLDYYPTSYMIIINKQNYNIYLYGGKNGKKIIAYQYNQAKLKAVPCKKINIYTARLII